jgi:eukaryotic-like serine/threonine-protein kinase
MGHCMSSAPNEGARQLRVGKYQVVNHIATGGMGAVYKAVDTVLKRDVALKVMNPELASNPGMMERFRREAQAAAKLNHENIISIFEFGEERGTYFIAMEYVDGEDLHSYVQRKGKLSSELACEVLRQALLALQHAHLQGVIHRDVKPSNFIIVKRTGKLLVKLGDMGLARQQHDQESRLTRAGTTVGTVDYMAPEQAKNSETADPRSDIYSLGCTLYHMLSGHAPFPEGSMVERMYKHLETEPPNVRDLNDTVPPGLAYILTKMLAKKPENRYQNVKEILSDLKRMDKLGEPRVPSKDILAGLLEGAMETPAEDDSTALKGKKAAAGKLRDNREAVTASPRARAVVKSDDDDDKPAKLAAPAAPDVKRKVKITPYVVVGVIAALLVVGGVIALSNFGSGNGKKSSSTVQVSSAGSSRVIQSSSSSSETSNVSGPSPHPGGIAWLTPSVENLKPDDISALKQEIEKPWAGAAGLPGTPSTLTVSRKFAEITSTQKNNLADAVGLVGRHESRIIEITDNGPLYEPSLALSDESHVVIRGAKGYRPMLVWDLNRNRESLTAFMALRQGSLTLEGLDIVVKIPAGAVEPLAVINTSDADFIARGCSFSVVGTSKGGVAAIRFEGEAARHRCRISNCVVRGSHLLALDVSASEADVLVENSLITGANRPVFQVAAKSSLATTLRLARSTVVAGENLLQVRGVQSEDTPALQFIGWDSILARSHTQPGGALVRVADGKQSSGLRWRAINCLTRLRLSSGLQSTAGNSPCGQVRTMK